MREFLRTILIGAILGIVSGAIAGLIDYFVNDAGFLLLIIGVLSGFTAGIIIMKD